MGNKQIFYDELKFICDNTRILESGNHVQHGSVSVLLHSVAIAYYSHSVSRVFKISVSEKELIRGALLHDYFLYDWHIKEGKRPLHGPYHPKIALENARRNLELTKVEEDIISRHMFPLTPVPPKYKESILVCLVDKACSIYEIFYKDAYPKLRHKILKKNGMYDKI